MAAAPTAERSRPVPAAKASSGVIEAFVCPMVLVREWTPSFAGAPDTLRIAESGAWTPGTADSVRVLLADGVRVVIATATRTGRAERRTAEGVVHVAVARCP